MASAYQRQGTGDMSISAPAMVLGVLLAESGGSASVVTLYDNTAASGNKLAVIAVEANGHRWIPFKEAGGLSFNTGVYAHVSAGTVDITVLA